MVVLSAQGDETGETSIGYDDLQQSTSEDQRRREQDTDEPYRYLRI